MSQQPLEAALWRQVPREAVRLSALAAPRAKEAARLLTGVSGVDVWYDPDGRLMLFRGPEEKAAMCRRAFPAADCVEHHTQTPAEVAPRRTWLLLKSSGAPLSPVAQLAGWKPGVWPTAPNVVTSTLGSGLLGAGLGYGGGWLAEQLLPPEYFQRGRLRKTTALLGAAAGMAPALWAGYDGWFDKDKPAPPGTQTTGDGPVPEVPGKVVSAAARGLSRVLTGAERRLHPWYERYAAAVKDAAADGGLEAGSGGTFGVRPIPTDQFNQAIWNDPYTPPAYAATASGVVEGASAMRGGSAFVSPSDIARVAVGMGAGYLQALAAGKVLGALAGLKPEAQQALQRAGTWAGLVRTAVPLLFGGG